MGNSNRILVVVRDAYGNLKDGFETLSTEVLEPEPVKSHVQGNMNQIHWIGDEQQSELQECPCIARHVSMAAVERATVS